MRRVAIDPILTAEAEPPARLSDHPGSALGADFRAPRSRLELDAYFWFCLDHVRAYNSAWNYYAGINEAEIEAEIRRDTTWQRPTWKLGMRHGPAYEARIRDPFGFYNGETGKKSGENRRAGTASDGVSRPATTRDLASAVFDLDPPFTQVSLKARYKVLVKLHHPDAHGGDKAAEEKLKIINQAYTTLKASYLV